MENSDKIKVGIIGATGYAGEELLRLLLNHPQTVIGGISSVSFEGESISKVYPSLSGFCDMVLSDEDTVIQNSDVVFASLPHGLSEPKAKNVWSRERHLLIWVRTSACMMKKIISNGMDCPIGRRYYMNKRFTAFRSCIGHWQPGKK